jgi:UDP-GlcNAc:undecaprenyl-phosphate GlcNAc-1-phosphate transferase
MAFLINLYLTPLLIYLSHKHGIFDKVDQRKIHIEDTSRLGGIGIYLSFIISSIFAPFIVSFFIDGSFAMQSSIVHKPLLIFSTFIIFITGVLDDFAQIRARYKLIGQFVAAIIAILAGALITQVQIPFTDFTIHLGYFSIPLTILWIIGVTNAINLIDGIDGLSAGISIIASMVFCIVFLFHGQYYSAIISFALTGSLFGYIFFNFPPAKIFMGDSGSLFLGFILSVLPLASFPQSPTSLVLPMTMLAIPILDVIAAIWRRTRDKKNVFSPDRFHIHHKMMDMDLGVRTILAIIYGICLILGIVTIIFEFSISRNFLWLSSAWCVTIGFFIYLHYRSKRDK